MPMTQTEATYVNVLLHWMMGTESAGGTVPDANAGRYAAAVLARSAAKVKGAGITPATVETWFDEAKPVVYRTDRVLPPIADLLARLWQIEKSDDEWDGGDTVSLLGEYLTEHGVASIKHPCKRNEHWTDDEFAEWDGDEAALQAFARAHGHDAEAKPDRRPVYCTDCLGEGAIDPDDGVRDTYRCPTCAGTGSTDADVIAAERAEQARAVRVDAAKVAGMLCTRCGTAVARTDAGDLIAVTGTPACSGVRRQAHTLDMPDRIVLTPMRGYASGYHAIGHRFVITPLERHLVHRDRVTAWRLRDNARPSLGSAGNDDGGYSVRLGRYTEARDLIASVLRAEAAHRAGDRVSL